MKERPILFKPPMVQAILAGNKTQTRRILKAPDSVREFLHLFRNKWERWGFDGNRLDYINCPYGQIGDQLWVRETWSADYPEVSYKAGGNSINLVDSKHSLELLRLYDTQGGEWRPSIHMPRWASRIQLEITNIRVERLQDISRQDAIAEGIRHSGLTINGISEGDHFYDYLMKTEDMCEWFTNPIASFQSLWHSINGPDSWTANPWVWVIEFQVLNP